MNSYRRVKKLYYREKEAKRKQNQTQQIYNLNIITNIHVTQRDKGN